MIKITDDEREQLEQEVAVLECQLRVSDYEVIKAYAYSVCGIKAPYDMDTVHKERQAKRDRINEIQKILSEEGR